jgi:hypothetical protein
MIPTEFPHLRYEEGSRQAGRPSDPLSLATLLTRLHLATTLRMGALQVESPKCGVCPLISSVGGRGIYRAVGELHRLGEVGLAPSGGRPAGWSSLHQLSPPPWPSTLHVDTCPRSRGPNRHKTWPAGYGVWPAFRPFRPGFGPLDPCVKYTPVVMMILTFGQLYFVIP